MVEHFDRRGAPRPESAVGRSGFSPIDEGEPIPFTQRNAEGYRYLLYVEVALRELARHELREYYGERWQKHIPGQYLQKIRKDQKDEVTQASLGFRTLGPLYYLTFGELVELSLQKPIVERLKKVLGQQGPELLRASVPARNAIAHCRDLTENALATVRALKMRLTTGLEAHDLVRLLHEPDIGIYPEEASKRLAGWLREVQRALRELQSLSADQDDYQEATRQYWWSSSDLAGFDVKRVDGLAAKIREYSCLQHGLGAAAPRQRFISESQILAELETAILMLGDTR